jgi:hypothetical protein
MMYGRIAVEQIKTLQAKQIRKDSVIREWWTSQFLRDHRTGEATDISMSGVWVYLDGHIRLQDVVQLQRQTFCRPPEAKRHSGLGHDFAAGQPETTPRVPLE